MHQVLNEDALHDVIADQNPTVGDDAIDAFIEMLYFFGEG